MFPRDYKSKKYSLRGNSKSLLFSWSNWQQTSATIIGAHLYEVCGAFGFTLLWNLSACEKNCAIKEVVPPHTIAVLELNAETSLPFFPWILSRGSTMGVLYSRPAWHAWYLERRCEQLPVPTLFALQLPQTKSNSVPRHSIQNKQVQNPLAIMTYIGNGIP